MCHMLRYSWEDWEEKDLTILVYPIIKICMYFHKRREMKELCPQIHTDPVMNGHDYRGEVRRKWSLPPALASASWTL